MKSLRVSTCNPCARSLRNINELKSIWISKSDAHKL
jgi:hypothetical protein